MPRSAAGDFSGSGRFFLSQSPPRNTGGIGNAGFVPPHHPRRTYKPGAAVDSGHRDHRERKTTVRLAALQLLNAQLRDLGLLLPAHDDLNPAIELLACHFGLECRIRFASDVRIRLDQQLGAA